MSEDTFLLDLASQLNLKLTELDLDVSFIQNGGHSLSAAAIVSVWNTTGRSIDVKTMLGDKSLRELVDDMCREGPLPSVQARSRFEDLSEEKIVRTAGQTPQDQHSQFVEFQDSHHSESSSDSLGSSTHSFSDATTTPSDIQDTPQKNMPLQSTSPPVERQAGRLTNMQLSFIHGSIKEPGMNIIAHSEQYLTKDMSKVKSAWKTVIETESAFHTPGLDEFREAGEGVFHWTELLSPLNEQEIHDRVRELRNQSKLECAFHVFPHHTSPGEEPVSTVSWIVHHAFVDGYSAALLTNKMQRLTAGLGIESSPPFSEFFDELEEFKRSRTEEGNNFWASREEFMDSARGHLLLAPSSMELKTTKFDEVVVDTARLQHTLPKAAIDLNVTPPAIFNAAWALVLSKYVDSFRPVFGVVLSGRDLPLPGIRDVCGPMLNTLPLTIDVKPYTSTKSFVRSVMEAFTEVSEFQWTTSENGFTNDFDSAIAVQFEPLQRPDGAVVPIGKPRTQQATEIPLSVIVEADYRVRLIYQNSRYRRIDMERIAACYYQVLQMIIQRTMTVEQIIQGMMPLSSKEQLSSYGNLYSEKTTRQSIREDLVTLFEQSARSHSLQPALQCGESQLTYAEYDQAASRLALRLSKTAKHGDIICVHADRSINWVIAIFAILKVGAIYCSLDADLPSNLRHTMVNNAAAKHFIIPHASQKEIVPPQCDYSFAVDEILINDQTQSSIIHRSNPEPWATAYLCYTSGSTGVPKGVQCTHEGLVAFQSNLDVRLFSQPGTKISQVMSPAFDGSIHEIFSALCHGGCLVLPSPGEPFGHLEFVDSAILTPSIAAVLDPQNYPRLMNVYLVGEPVSQYVNDKWSVDRNLYNMYGPTEGTCGATIKRLLPEEPVTIGAPNPTTRIYILDSTMRMTTLGVVGEIYLAGVQVSLGYLHLPEQTAERFLNDTIIGNGEMMYKTGDKGYWNESGEIVCLGRNDRQIKLRGYRLDMNDLEIRAARAVPEIETIAIAPQKDYLVAMVQPGTIDVKKLVEQLSKVLPTYAIPRHIMAVETIPTTRAGKIDYGTLSKSSFATPANSLRNLETPTEKTVGVAYRYVLELGDSRVLYAQSDFIDLGGQSLRQLSLSIRLGKEFGCRIPLQLIIENSSVETLSAALDSFLKSRMGETSLSQTQVNHQYVSSLEKDWLQRYSFNSGTSCLNVVFATTFKSGKVDRSHLADAWDHVLSRHKILRCRYITRNGKSPRRTYSDHPPRTERVKDLDLWAEINRPFLLDQSGPIRVLVSDDKLVVVISHIVADYTTLSILLREASVGYKSGYLPPVQSTYVDALRSRDIPRPCQLSFWDTYLEGCPAIPKLFGRSTERQGYSGTSAVSKLPRGISRKLLAFARRSTFTLQQLATAAVAIILHRDTPVTDAVVIIPYLNRSTEESLEAVGLFLEPLPVRVSYFDNKDSSIDTVGAGSSITENSCQDQYLEAVRSSSQAALAHAVPWNRLLEQLSVGSTFPDHPLSDVTVSFHDAAQTKSLSLGTEEGFEPCFLWSQGSKFKLMVEFTELESGDVMLRLEYDPTCVLPEEVGLLRWGLPAALGWLSEGLGHQDIKKMLNEEHARRVENASWDHGMGKEYLGCALSAL